MATKRELAAGRRAVPETKATFAAASAAWRFYRQPGVARAGPGRSGGEAPAAVVAARQPRGAIPRTNRHTAPSWRSRCAARPPRLVNGRHVHRRRTGKPLDVRLVVSEIRAEAGLGLARWRLWTKVPAVAGALEWSPDETRRRVHHPRLAGREVGAAGYDRTLHLCGTARQHRSGPCHRLKVAGIFSANLLCNLAITVFSHLCSNYGSAGCTTFSEESQS